MDKVIKVQDEQMTQAKKELLDLFYPELIEMWEACVRMAEDFEVDKEKLFKKTIKEFLK
jgi:hypothetical protein